MVHCEESDDDDRVINETLQSSLTTKDVEALQKQCSARKDRDLADLDKLLDWFHDHNPCVCNSDDLHSLSTGLTSEKGDAINCDIAEEV